MMVISHPLSSSCIHYDMASSLFNLHARLSVSTISLQVFFCLPLGLAPSTSYFIHFFTQSLSSFCSMSRTIATCFAVLPRLCHIYQLVQVPTTMEICMVPKTSAASQYPGIYLFTTVARMMRPVWNYSCKSAEMIGTFEQVYLNIAVTDSEANQSVSNVSAYIFVLFNSIFFQNKSEFPMIELLGFHWPIALLYASIHTRGLIILLLSSVVELNL